jgi:phosphoribosylanthranilate isomerase
MTRVKVCGVTREEDIDVVADAGADAVGVVAGVSVDTPREVGLDRAGELFAHAPPFLTTVLVTMPETVEEATERVERTAPDALQLHGGLSPEEVEAVTERVDGTVLVATDQERAPEYATVANGLLVDSVDESGAGGTGETHDWGRTRELVESLSVPVLLAGGLTPENVPSAVRTVRPYGVDVASGTEASGGVKDHGKVRAFVRRARVAGVGEAPESTHADESEGEDVGSEDLEALR